jgi:hypothetical protein
MHSWVVVESRGHAKLLLKPRALARQIFSFSKKSQNALVGDFSFPLYCFQELEKAKGQVESRGRWAQKLHRMFALATR